MLFNYRLYSVIIHVLLPQCYRVVTVLICSSIQVLLLSHKAKICVIRLKTKGLIFLNLEIKRGCIYYVDFGEERIAGIQSGNGRPALIISNDIGNKFSKSVICICISASTRKDFPINVN
ncbi:type II toxin-antitoxin system PemK/MazF family toxin [Paenibacillus sp. TAF43_2]|uniref:type II toxin-antitoxin system PemK/MazF family toxin n=1 Tax=Paenibacillus sp. TAF43_2 TaxID=3233069 RepID=UPI003F9BDA4F